MATTSRLPKWIKPQLAHLVGEAPAGDQRREQMLPVCLPRKSGVGPQRSVCGMGHLRI